MIIEALINLGGTGNCPMNRIVTHIIKINLTSYPIENAHVETAFLEWVQRSENFTKAHESQS